MVIDWVLADCRGDQEVSVFGGAERRLCIGWNCIYISLAISVGVVVVGSKLEEAAVSSVCVWACKG
jgi:hypothetical protein